MANVKNRNLTRSGLNLEGPCGLRAARRAAHANKAGTGNLDQHAVTRVEQLERLAVPRTPAPAYEAVLNSVRPRSVLALTEGTVKLTVPWFAGAYRCRGGCNLRMNRVKQPGAAKQLFSAWVKTWKHSTLMGTSRSLR